jgi:vacuolar-type H+-ATPase subunit I/STV1
MERQIGSLASDIKANQGEMRADRKADQEMMEANQARMKERLKEATRVTVSVIEGKMEAAVNSVRSELDEKIEKTQAKLRTVEASLDIRVRKLEVSLENMKTDFITNLTMSTWGPGKSIEKP